MARPNFWKTMNLSTSLTTVGAAILVSTLLGCGGGGATSTADVPAAAPAVVDNSGVRGTLIRNPPDRALSLSPSQVTAQADKFGAYGQRLNLLAGPAKCGIDIRHFEYATVGAAAEKTTASGALMVPTGSDPACTGARPIVMYAHGSSPFRSTNLADLTPAAPYGLESMELAALYAAQGWIVVAPNYAGYDSSTLGYHPHHIADQQSRDMIDALAAARKALAGLGLAVSDNAQLFLTGHSEGGYVTMATVRAMQQAGMSVTAAAPSSGAYAESINWEPAVAPGAFDDLSGIDAGAILKFAMQFTAWQKADGDLYQSPSELYPDAYAATMESIGPSDTPARTLVAQGRLPRYLLSNDEPRYAGLTPAQQALYGAPEQSLIRTSFLQSVVADAAAHPCPYLSTTEPLACTRANPTREAWFRNDLRTFTPTVPMLMCGGHDDPEVWFQNTVLTDAYFVNHGLATGLVTVLDVDAPAAAGDPYALAKATFAQIRDAIAATGADTKAYYHGDMLSAACQVAARDFFRTFR